MTASRTGNGTRRAPGLYRGCAGQRTYGPQRMERPRSFDVDAATDHTRILSLSEGALRTMIAEDATIAAKLSLNL